MRKQIAIHGHTITQQDYNRAATRAILASGAHQVDYSNARFLYSRTGEILGGAVLVERKVNNYVRTREFVCYIHR